MNTKTTLAALLVAIALGVYVMFVGGGGGGAGEGKAGDRLVLGGTPLTTDKINRLRIEQPGQPTVVFERDLDRDDSWRQVEPVTFPVQHYYPESVLDRLVAIQYGATVTPADKGYTLDQLGLAPPRAIVTIEGPGVGSHTLTLGREAAGGRAYLTLGAPAADQPVFVAEDILHQMLVDQDFKQWRQPNLAAYPPGSVRKFTLKRGDETITLLNTAGDWTLAEPVVGRADRGAALGIAGTIASAQIKGFVADQPQDLSKYGLTQPAVTLDVQLVDAAKPDPSAAPPAGASSHTLRVGAAVDLTAEQYFAMFDDAPTVFTLGKLDVDRLRTPLDKLRDARLTPVPRTDVQRIDVERDGKTQLAATHAVGGWSFALPAPPYDVDSPIVDHLLDAVFNTKASSFVDLTTARLKAPVASITLGVGDARPAEKLQLHDGGDGNLLVVRAGEPVGHVVPADAFKLAFAKPLTFRSRVVLPITAPDITELRVIRSGRYPADYRLKRRPLEEAGPAVAPSTTGAKPKARAGEWLLDGYDAKAVHRLIDRISPLIVDQWLEEPPITTPEGVTLQIKLADGSTRTLSIHPASLTGRVDGEATAFKVDQALADAALAELRDKVVLSLDAKRIATVSDGSITVERHADGKFTLTGSGQLNETAAAAWFDAIAGLKAERFVSKERALGDPAVTLTIKTVDAQAYTLRLWAGPGVEPVAQVGERWFTLPATATATLLRRPVR
ncbi:MAG: DUF4340 domain-containing protein [Phycisphaera sp.]|nr:DUF4340 domain-containing protein [Phycisphaera sp.]